jgi:molybdopterin converting factor small subunit
VNGILFVDQLTVTVELFGTARHLAGVATVTVQGRAIADLLRAVERTCARLEGLVMPDGALSRRFLVSIDGERFVSDLAEPMPPGARLLILGADAGG